MSRLEDIRVYGEQALSLMAGRDVDAFAADLTIQLAILHCLTLVGEAANQVSEETRSTFPEVPWSKIIGLRHVIVHHYRKVDLREIWMIVTRHLPSVVGTVSAYLKNVP